MQLTKKQIRQINKARELVEQAETLFNKAVEGMEYDPALRDAQHSLFEATRKTYNWYNIKMNN